MAAMMTLVGAADELDALDELEPIREPERGALVVLSEDEFRDVISRLSPGEPQVA
jgi:hypothetical protein